MSSWIERELEQSLRPVPAPDELWEHVRNPSERRARIVWWKPAFALVLVVATAWALHPRAAALESDRSSEIHDWVMARTGLDVALSPAAPLRLCGIRMVGKSVEIRYKMRDREATVMVAKAERYTASHEFVSRSSWIMRGQSYTVSGDLQTACLLCHADPDAVN